MGGFTDPGVGGAAATAAPGGQELQFAPAASSTAPASQGSSPIDTLLMGTRYRQEDLQTIAASITMVSMLVLLAMEVS